MLPRRIKITSVIKSRYTEIDTDTALCRPKSWDSRLAEVEVVKDHDNQEVKLRSNGGQSSPQEGWELMLTAGDPEQGYEWTLYSLGLAS